MKTLIVESSYDVTGKGKCYAIDLAKNNFPCRDSKTLTDLLYKQTFIIENNICVVNGIETYGIIGTHYKVGLCVKMLDKYYTPSYEELHIGYELESKVFLNDGKTDWFKVPLLNIDYSLKEYIKQGYCRTAYLTEEDILKEFDLPVDKEIWNGKYWNIWNDSSKHNYIIRYRFENQNMEICKDDDADVVFRGYVPSINEFKTLMKWLKIK